MAPVFPAIKRDVRNFLTREEGKIARKAVLRGGALIATWASAMEAWGHGSHANDWAYIHTNTATSCHSSHDSHGSHGSHASW